MTVENISIDVKTNANKAARHFDSLAASLEKVAKAANVTNAEKAVDSIGSAAQRAKKNTEPLSAELQRAIENATKYDVLVHKAAAAELKMNKAFKTGNEDSAWSAREHMINSELQAEREKMKELSENGRQGVSPDLRGIIQAANEVDVLKAKLESLKTSMQEAFAAGNVEGAYAIQGKILSTERQIERAEEAARKNGEEAQDAAPKVSGLATAIQKLVGAFKNLSTHGNKASSAVRSVGGSAKHSTGFLEKMWNSIKRIALYRALRTFIKDLTKAFQDGLKQAYHFSQSVGGALAQALDQMSSASGQMKNQMGAAFGELLQTIMPIIEAIIAAITRLMQALSALFAALGGRATFLVADKAADSWDKASGAAKKYKNTILGFDEINRLNDEQGGGGGGSSDFGGGFTEAGLPDWAEKIRKAIEDGDWRAAGEALADHLNKLIDEWDAYAAGQKIGKKINNAIQFAFGFLKRFNFGKLGQRVAEFFNGALFEIDTETLGRTLVLVFTGALDFLIGFLTNLDTLQLGQKIAAFIVGAFDEATQWLESKNWSAIARLLSLKILAFFEGLDPVKIAQSIGKFLATALKSATEFINNVKWEEIGKKIGEWFTTAMKNVPWADIAQNAWDLLGAAMGGVSGFAGGLLEGAIGQKIEGIVQEITRILSDASLVLGAILLFTGHIPLGLGLIIAGLAGKDKAAEDWDKVPTQVQEKIAAIELVASTAMLALGIILMLSGAAIPLGLGMVAAGATMLATTAAENWEKIPQEVQTKLAVIGTVVGVALMAIGIVLLLTGAGIGLGLGCILAASSILAVTVSSFDLDGTTNDINGAMESVGSTGETQFGKIATAINKIIDAVKSVIDWFSRMKTSISEVNSRLSDIDQHKSMYGSGWGEFVRGSELGLYAEGGTIPNGSGTLFVAGEAGAEVVTQMGNQTGVTNVKQMGEAVAYGNSEVVSAVYAMANMIVKAVDSKDVDVVLDGQSMADKLYRYNQQAANRYGVAMVT